MSPRRTKRFPLLLKRPLRSFIATCVSASFFLGATASHGQAGQGSGASGGVPAGGQQNPAAIDPQTVSCSDLKARMQSTGQLPILVGSRGGWPDTFYGPKVPRCQFWQMPLFQYVRTNDGLCGVGYICIDKMSLD
jgi:hypothetical protein